MIFLNKKNFLKFLDKYELEQQEFAEMIQVDKAQLCKWIHNCLSIGKKNRNKIINGVRVISKDIVNPEDYFIIYL